MKRGKKPPSKRGLDEDSGRTGCRSNRGFEMRSAFGCRGCLLHIDERSAIITVHFVGRFIEGQRDLLLCGGSVDGTLGVVTLLS